MVVNMMKWRPWIAASSSRCFQVKIKLHHLEGLSNLVTTKSNELGIGTSLPGSKNTGELKSMMVHVKWKGPRGGLSSRFKRSLKRARSTSRVLEDAALLSWEEEFEHVCMFNIAKDGQFLPWDICFLVKQVDSKSKSVILGTAWMNVAEMAPTVENLKQTATLQIMTPNRVECQSALVVTVDFVELRIPESLSFDYPILSCIGGPLLCNADEQLGVEEAELRQQTENDFFTVTTKEGNDLELPAKAVAETVSDSSRDSIDSESDTFWDDKKSFESSDIGINGYGPLTGVNLVVEGALQQHPTDSYVSSSTRSIRGSPRGSDQIVSSDSEQSTEPIVTAAPTVRSILGWRKRKLKFQSSKWKGEPLLKKDYGEEGGDDIDFDRRLAVVSHKESLSEVQVDTSSTAIPGCLDFGDEHFAVGSWERKSFCSRDGQMKLEGDVFFATIDQRSEKAAGESACTALVAVISVWLHQNPGRMPIKAELDMLIREGSAEWRELCKRETYKELFPDGHFDLETVIHSKVWPLVEVAEKSYVGFFQFNGLGDSCDYLQGAMSFDSMWEEIIAKQEGDGQPATYVVSWNDHFFIVKIDMDSCYIIDTLGERLFEGSNQAYIIRFDKETRLYNVPAVESKKDSVDLNSPNCKPREEVGQPNTDDPHQVEDCQDEGSKTLTEVSVPSHTFQNENVYTGKEACKEFIKGFFAALPLSELEREIKKGLHGNTLHQRLQIEFHYTSLIDRLSSGESD
ncbi:hypothetical protein KP509_12G049000 [Ceratopteris richardii]|nr:hypothetical protein KP509_12G049000 [Ceratopteris richardii]KAH7423315.1 hypothetical protein KP509_12G049000 [Ceratopteris richardii]KAH7423320.1 hypothetical protein KP509_12G049000 [Ceratopteris richardii]